MQREENHGQLHYTSDRTTAFSSVICMRQEVNHKWLIQYLDAYSFMEEGAYIMSHTYTQKPEMLTNSQYFE